MTIITRAKLPVEAYLAAGVDGYPWATLRQVEGLRVDLDSLHRATVAAGVRYQLGAKPTSDTLPGSMVKSDCSGYVGWLLTRSVPAEVRALAAADLCGRGTFHLDQWARRCGFKRSDVASALMHDGALRLAVTLAGRLLRMGHVALVRDGQTLECCGSRGVCSRPWTGQGWQARCAVYVLCPPRSIGG